MTAPESIQHCTLILVPLLGLVVDNFNNPNVCTPGV
jgi:hypothetical protein